MQFKDVIGQKETISRLVATVKRGRISHAQLFSGKYGYGTFALVMAYIQYICCTDKAGEDSCGKCPSCRKMEKLAHPDLHFSFPVSTNDKVKSKPNSELFIEDWRKNYESGPYFDTDDWMRFINTENKQGLINVDESQRVLKKLSLKAYESEFKFLVIWGADKLNVQASNKLLKLIEEPQEKTVIILLSDQPEFILQTIRSRTQLVRVPPISTESMINALGGITTSEEAIRTAQNSNGDFIKAKRKISTQEESKEFFDWFKAWMRNCYKADIHAMYKWVEEISASSVGREKRKRFLRFALDLMREAMVLNYSNNEMSTFGQMEKEFIGKFQPFVHQNNVVEMSNILNEAFRDISRNVYSKIVFMDLSMKFANLLHTKS